MSDLSASLGTYNAYKSMATTDVPRRLEPSAIDRSASDQDQSRSVQQNKESDKMDPGVTDELNLSREAQEVRELQMRDREVRAHELAHAAVGGSYAGSPSYTYERGADGRSYAVGGSVRIDVSPIPGDPQATLQKARQVRAAALAPIQPSAQDMQVAHKAQSMATQARNEFRVEQMEERKEMLEPQSDDRTEISVEEGVSISSRHSVDHGPVRLEIYS